MGCTASTSVLHSNKSEVVGVNGNCRKGQLHSDNSTDSTNDYNKNCHKQQSVEAERIDNEQIITCDNELLSKQQKSAIFKTWEILSPHQIHLGAKVFLRIFDQEPKIKAMFSFRDIWGEALLNNPAFEAHSLRFIQIIQTAVDGLDDMDNQLVPVVHNLGKFHKKRSTWFTPEYFEVFVKAVLYVWKQEMGNTFTSDVKDAWIIILAFIVQHLKEGYNS